MTTPSEERQKPDGAHAKFSQAKASTELPHAQQLNELLPALQLVYDTAPVGIAFLTPDCRYVQINSRLAEICGIPVADHIGRTVRQVMPKLANQVERIVQDVVITGESTTGVEVSGQRADKRNADHVWVTNWHPLKGADGNVVGVNVVTEDVTARKRAGAVLNASERALRETETRFRELADNISQFAWTADESGWIYWYNKRWLEYTGTTLDEMQGWGWQKVHHPDHVERVVERIRRSFDDGTPWEDTFPLRGRDGSFRWFLSRALPIRNEAGEVIRWFGTNTDVTKQIEAEKALRELNETLEQRVAVETKERLQVWNVSQDLLAVADLDGTYLSVNPAWTATLGWSEAELVGKPMHWLLHSDDVGRTQTELRQLAAGKKTVRFENRLRHKSGSYRWLSWNATSDGGRIYAMGRDFTDLKEAENELREARRELAQAAERSIVAAMTASIAHEINQPLTAIVADATAGLSWLDRPNPELDAAREALRSIAADGMRASEVVRSLRAMFSKDEQPATSFDANELIQQTCAIVRGELDSAHVVVELNLSKEAVLLHGRRGQLQQLILNLLANATDAMRSIDGRPRSLRVISEVVAGENVAISVADSGTGIEPRSVERIFEPFFSTKKDGMGMGLAICRSIAETHGGTLSVSPGELHGAVFRVVLPSGHAP
jgi:PAS domain S-box-containing protein